MERDQTSDAVKLTKSRPRDTDVTYNWLMDVKKVKVSSYIAHHPVRMTAQSDLQFTHYSLFNQTPSQPGWLDPWEAFSYAAINARGLLVQTDTTAYSQVLIHTAELTGLM